MTKASTTSDTKLNDDHVECVVGKLRDAMRDCCASIDPETIRHVFGVENIDMMMCAPFRKLAAAMSHVIDCDSDPPARDGWAVEEHQRAGQVRWNPTAVSLHLSKRQMGEGVVRGKELREIFVTLPVMNACVLDFLLAHPEFIPEEWKGKCVFFWGTVYRYSFHGLCVRFLFWREAEGVWDWSHRWLDEELDRNMPAAVFQPAV